MEALPHVTHIGLLETIKLTKPRELENPAHCFQE